MCLLFWATVRFTCQKVLTFYWDSLYNASIIPLEHLWWCHMKTKLFSTSASFTFSWSCDGPTLTKTDTYTHACEWNTEQVLLLCDVTTGEHMKWGIVLRNVAFCTETSMVSEYLSTDEPFWNLDKLHFFLVKCRSIDFYCWRVTRYTLLTTTLSKILSQKQTTTKNKTKQKKTNKQTNKKVNKYKIK